MHDKWMKGAPEYQNGWDRDISEWKDQGYLVEPVGGRRRDFLDSHGGDEAVNELVNFKVQGGAAGWMNKAILEIYEQIPEHKWGPGTGIINQCHDHIVVECPESEALWVSGVIERAMNGTHPGLPDVELTASADIGPSWDKV
jgi:DNA polymerase I-like protein with 3'-5' exonuclease and polymerase domains